MGIYNRNIRYISGYPSKAHTPLFVETDAERVRTISLQRLPVAVHSVLAMQRRNVTPLFEMFSKTGGSGKAEGIFLSLRIVID